MNSLTKWQKPIVHILSIKETTIQARLRILTQTCIVCNYQNVVKVDGYSDEAFDLANSMVKNQCPVCGATRLEESWSANPNDSHLFGS